MIKFTKTCLIYEKFKVFNLNLNFINDMVGYFLILGKTILLFVRL